MQAITDSDFQTETGNGLVLVDFWAEWCGPCRMLNPILEELEKDYGEKIKIRKLNVDENQQTAAALSVSSIPTLILYKDGQIVERALGALPKPQLKKLIEPHIG